MLPSGAVASPRPDVLRRELDAFRSIADSTPRPEFEVRFADLCRSISGMHIDKLLLQAA